MLATLPKIIRTIKKSRTTKVGMKHITIGIAYEDPNEHINILRQSQQTGIIGIQGLVGNMRSSLASPKLVKEHLLPSPESTEYNLVQYALERNIFPIGLDTENSLRLHADLSYLEQYLRLMEQLPRITAQSYIAEYNQLVTTLELSEYLEPDPIDINIAEILGRDIINTSFTTAHAKVLCTNMINWMDTINTEHGYMFIQENLTYDILENLIAKGIKPRFANLR